MTIVSSNNISFQATPKEIKDIEKACLNLSNNINNKPEKKESFDVAQLGSKAYISKVNEDGKLALKVELKNGDAKAYTFVNTGDVKNIKKILTSQETVKKLANTIDDLKELMTKVLSKESYK